MSAEIEKLAAMFRESEGATVLTGAGVSTESGIPDFRSPGGVYSKLDPMECLSVYALEDRPPVFWKAFDEVFGGAGDAEPNQGHRMLAWLEEQGFLEACVTQNIDGLHQKAGSENVIEVHGHLRTARCKKCGWRCPLREALDQLAERPSGPVCSECGADMRPDVILFGDMLDVLEQAVEVVSRCELLLVVGSSLSVSPVNSLAYEARRVAIINRDATMLDHLAEIVINEGAGDSLERLVRALDGE